MKFKFSWRRRCVTRRGFFSVLERLNSRIKEKGKKRRLGAPGQCCFGTQVGRWILPYFLLRGTDVCACDGSVLAWEQYLQSSIVIIMLDRSGSFYLCPPCQSPTNDCSACGEKTKKKRKKRKRKNGFQIIYLPLGSPFTLVHRRRFLPRHSLTPRASGRQFHHQARARSSEHNRIPRTSTNLAARKGDSQFPKSPNLS